MNYMERLSSVKVLILGAVNGLIVGLALEKARVAYLNYQGTQAAREYAQKYPHSDIWGDFFELRWEPQVPLLSILVFALVAYLIYECFLNRPRLLLMLWFGLGIFALSVGYFMATLNPDLFSYLWLFGMVLAACVVHQFWRRHPDSLPLLWAINGISAVIVGAAGIQLIGVLFWWPNARRPLIWLIVLVGAVTISAVFGAFVQFLLNRNNGPRYRKMAALAIMVSAILTFGLAQYFFYRYDNGPGFSAAQTVEGPGASSAIPKVEFCELLRNPFAYGGQVIRIDSTLGRFRDYVTFYDAACVPRHPLINVSFSPSLENKTQSGDGEKLRQIMTGSKMANEGNLHLFVSAVGTFEPIPRERRRDFTELQYEFTVTKIVEAK